MEKIYMLSAIIQAFKKVGYVHLYTFCKLIVWYTAAGLLKPPYIAHQPD